MKIEMRQHSAFWTEVDSDFTMIYDSSIKTLTGKFGYRELDHDLTQTSNQAQEKMVLKAWEVYGVPWSE